MVIFSHDIAEKLGVRSFRRILLAESADSMNLSLSGAAEAFGQHESLTTRLRHILEMYADGPAVLFELVQNAEDAGASNVTFLLDKTHYGTSSLLSPEMGDWQGPALYCFNDSIFSPQDLYAISRIGQESKLEKPFAIGRFGLGFNCVYHFTDIPAFVSGENIVMFDPHACNLPGISPTHPGLGLNLRAEKSLEQFPDQFSPFLHFGCDLQRPFPGTLFRFALRSANAASRSQIKKEVYAPSDVLSLFSSFSEVVSATLLFLRNLDGLSKDQFLQKLSKSIDRNVPWRSQKLLVSEQNPAATPINSVEIGQKLGGSEENLDESFPNTADILQKLQASTRSTLDFDGRAFCFLPLPISTGGFGPWTSLIRKFYQFVSESGLCVLYTKARGGQWISTKQAIFPDHNFDKAWELLEALSNAGLPVVSIPKEIVNRFMEICPSLHFLTPQLLRTLLIRRSREFTDRNAMILTLEYCLLDLRSPVISKNFYGLPLIPLSSGAFAKLDKRGLSEQIYVTRADGYSLLKDSIPHQLVDCEISDHLYHKLCALAESKDFNISFLTCQLLENILMRVIPAEWHYAKQVLWVPGNQGHPSVEWVTSVELSEIVL
ncbi:UNVERIFIED_CONTAM: Sacsin [Sesamum radiatum]|uniref:Sacsin n=1 Tax=Sesamum radiatum TaxID=300843 RepID=A0AAW2R2R1_SESRA